MRARSCLLFPLSPWTRRSYQSILSRKQRTTLVRARPSPQKCQSPASPRISVLYYFVIDIQWNFLISHPLQVDLHDSWWKHGLRSHRCSHIEVAGDPSVDSELCKFYLLANRKSTIVGQTHWTVCVSHAGQSRELLLLSSHRLIFFYLLTPHRSSAVASADCLVLS